MVNYILTSIGVFLVVILLIVIILLVAKKFLSPSGKVKVTVNGNIYEVEQGASVLSTLAEEGVYLP